MRDKESSIKIDKQVKGRIGLDNYKELPLNTIEEKILCSLLVNLCISEDPISPKVFIGYCSWLAYELFKGLSVNPNLYPMTKDKPILREARSLKGKNFRFMERNSYLDIAEVISGEISEDLKNNLKQELKMSSFPTWL